MTYPTQSSPKIAYWSRSSDAYRSKHPPVAANSPTQHDCWQSTGWSQDPSLLITMRPTTGRQAWRSISLAVTCKTRHWREPSQSHGRAAIGMRPLS